MQDTNVKYQISMQGKTNERMAITNRQCESTKKNKNHTGSPRNTLSYAVTNLDG